MMVNDCDVVPVDGMVRAAANVKELPVVRALLCSLTRCTRDLPVWPMYVCFGAVRTRVDYT